MLNQYKFGAQISLSLSLLNFIIVLHDLGFIAFLELHVDNFFIAYSDLCVSVGM